tara:strand:+ start:1053 stop:1298 length:246 start_codon:yes stop_codon:yes gene_type:complete
MNNPKLIIEKLGKFIEQGIINYKDLSAELINICKSKRNEFIYKMKITGKEETDILNRRLEKLEKKVEILEKKLKSKKAKKS